MRKRLLSTLLTLAILLTMAAIVPAAGLAEGKTELVIVDSEWQGIDMFQCTSWNGIQQLIADTILIRGDDGATLPCIASASVWSEDGLTWTLTIPEGMYYSTGAQVEPEDLKASIEWGLQVSTYGVSGMEFESIEVSGRDVIFHLSQYMADLEYNFMDGFIGVIDKDELDSMTAEELLWGCHPYGPYYVEDYSPGAYAILKANPGYKTNNPLVENQGPSKIDTIRVVMDVEDFTAYTGIGTGEYDVLASAPSDYVEDLMADPNLTVVTATGASVKYFEMNITNEFLSDMNVRKAIIHGINRDNINAYVNSFHVATYCLVQELCLNYDPAAEEYYKANYGYDPDLAMSLLAESGYTDTDGDGYVDKDGKKLTLNFKIRDDDTAVMVGESVRADMKAIGIDLTLEPQNWSYVNQSVVDGDFDLAYLGLGWGEPMLLVNRFCNRNPDVTNLDLAGQMELVNEAATTIDYDARTKIITQIQEKLFDYCTIVPLLSDLDGFRVWRSEIEGIVTTPTGGFYLGDVK